jgi:hypothetical protein
VQHFESDKAVKALLPRLVNNAHTAAADLLQDLEIAESRSDQ